jgi:hypothetical protein
LSQRPRTFEGPGMGGEMGEQRTPRTAGPAVGTFSQAERIREEEEGQTQPSVVVQPTGSGTAVGGGGSGTGSGTVVIGGTEMATPRAATSLARRFGSLLGGGSASKRVSSLIERDHRDREMERERQREREREMEDSKSAKSADVPSSRANTPSVVPSASGGIPSTPTGGASHRRAATVTESGGVGRKHERRGSLGVTRHEGSGREELVRPKTAGDGWASSVKEEKKKEEIEEKEREVEREKERERDEGGPMDVKPVYLKGLFRCVFSLFGPTWY